MAAVDGKGRRVVRTENRNRDRLGCDAALTIVDTDVVGDNKLLAFGQEVKCRIGGREGLAHRSTAGAGAILTGQHQGHIRRERPERGRRKRFPRRRNRPALPEHRQERGGDPVRIGEIRIAKAERARIVWEPGPPVTPRFPCSDTPSPRLSSGSSFSPVSTTVTVRGALWSLPSVT